MKGQDLLGIKEVLDPNSIPLLCDEWSLADC